MNILKTSKELNPTETYLLTKSPSVVPVKSVEDNTVIAVKCWLLYTDIDSKGDEVELLSIMGEDNTVVACQSATFKRSFADLVDIFGTSGFSIKKISGTTKSDRGYVNCDLAI